MALVTCPECSKQVSSAANQCPSCGYPLSAQSKPLTEPLPTSASPHKSKTSVNAPAETHFVVHVAPKEWRGLATTGWLLLGGACALSLVPFLGFASWVVIFPVLITTSILARIVITRGGTGQGILLILTSIFIVPVFVFCAPFLSSLFGLAGMAPCEQKKQKNAAQQRQHTSLSTPFSPAAPAVLARVVPPQNKVADSVSESDLIGIWQGPRHTIEFFPNHTFKQNGLYLPDRMKWRLDERKLTVVYPDLGDKSPAWYPTSGASTVSIVSVTPEKLVTEAGNNTFVNYRIANDSRSAIDAAATRAKTEQELSSDKSTPTGINAGGQDSNALNSSRKDVEEFKRFVARHEETEKSHDIERILDDYAATVDYFDNGAVDRNFIRKDKTEYFGRWPEANDWVIGDVAVQQPAPNQWRANYRVGFRVENTKGEWIQGEADNELGVVNSGGKFQITFQHGKIVRREKGTIGHTKQLSFAGTWKGFAKTTEGNRSKTASYVIKVSRDERTVYTNWDDNRNGFESRAKPVGNTLAWSFRQHPGNTGFSSWEMHCSLTFDGSNSAKFAVNTTILAGPNKGTKGKIVGVLSRER